MSTSRRQLFSALVILAALYVWTAYFVRGGLVDDAYIFLRYARNVWAGAGAVFNPGDRVEGYTSPLWLACATALYSLPIPPPIAIRTASALLACLTIAALAIRLRTRRRLSAFVGASFVASSPVFVYWSQSGMETTLFAFLLTATMLALDEPAQSGSTTSGAGLWLALAALTRPEAVTLIVPILAWAIGQRATTLSLRRVVAGLSAPIVLLVGAHEIWRHSYYGEWLPNTFAAKVDIPVSVLLWSGLSYVARAGVVAAPIVAILFGLAHQLRGESKVSVGLHLLVIAWFTGIVVASGGDHFALFRFFAPVVPVAGMAAAKLVDSYLGRSSRPLGSAGLMAILLISVNAWIFALPDVENGRWEVRQASAWARTGQWCAGNLPAGTLATTVVGAIPYYCDRVTYDLLGLTDWHVAHEGSVFVAAAPGHQKFDSDYILSRRPTYIFFPSSGLVAEPFFKTRESRFHLPERSTLALRDLTTRPEIEALYQYRAEPVGDGTWVEFLQRRQP